MGLGCKFSDCSVTRIRRLIRSRFYRSNLTQGQPKFRNMWDRYARGADAIVYVVDAADVRELVLDFIVPVYLTAVHVL
jgi:hypothetical protein